MNEASLQNQILRLLGGQPNIRVFRNHVGGGWTGGKTVMTQGNSIILHNARWQAFGLHPGSADLIGWKTVTITPEMVGQRLAVFLSVEIKTARGTIQPHQKNWAQRVLEAGGVAAIVRSLEEAKALIQ